MIEARSNGKKFVYETNIFRFPKKSVKINVSDVISKKDLTIAYDEVEKVLDSDIFSEDFLRNTVISISPFKIQGIKAFTENFGSDGVTIVLGLQDKFRTEKEFREYVRSTLLHEIGHVLHEKNTNNKKSDLNEDFWIEYKSYYKDEDLRFSYKENSTAENWTKDIRENMAEDFKIYYSDKLGNNSFKAESKKTKMYYNPEVGKFLDKYLSKNFKSNSVRLKRSTVESGDDLLTLYDYRVRELENKDGLKVRVQTSESEKYDGSYIAMWENVNEGQTNRISVNNKRDTIVSIPKDSEITTVIKYEKVNDKYIVVWRLNIK